VLAAALLGLGLTAIPANASCGSPRISLSGFALGSQLPRFYHGPEGVSTTLFASAAEFCPNQPPFEGSATWQITPATTETSPDSGTFNFEASGPHDVQVDDAIVNFPQDSVEDPAAEGLTVSLTTPAQGTLVEPRQGTIYMVDDEGTTRVTTAATGTLTPSVVEGLDGFFKFPVFMAGAAVSNTVTVTVSGGTAGTDYTSPVSETFSSRFNSIEIPILDDSQVEGTETYTATITGTTAGTISTPSQMTFQVIDDDSDDDPPLTSFHHPKHNQTLKYRSPKAKSIHVFVPKDPSGIASAKTALRRIKKSGACQWWDGNGWSPDSCGDAAREDHWLSTKKILTLNTKFVYEHILKEHLKPSVGAKTTIKKYCVYSTAEDGEGNTDDVIELGRNKNKFEIKKS
jgi:hypothetical protein